MNHILVLHGPNLNLLGSREPDVYGRETLADIDAALVERAHTGGCSLRCVQRNAEHQLLTDIHSAPAEAVDFIIINPAALTHTSVALRDALLGVAIPFIEVHLSNVHSRESFRHHSYLSDVAIGVVTGLGPQGYDLALQAAMRVLQTNKAHN